MGGSLTNGDAETRVHDFLEDRLQTNADLESLDVLLENVKKQQALLQTQLDEARHDLAQNSAKAEEQAAALARDSAAFREQQAGIDTTLMIVTQSDSTEDAVARFQPVMQRLQRLEVATAYVDLLDLITTLSQECLSKIASDVDRAIAIHQRMVGLASRLIGLQDAADGAAPHLMDFVAATVDGVRRSLLKRLASDLETTLARTSWPKTSAAVPAVVRPKWDEQVRRLLVLQKPDLLRAVDDNANRLTKDEPKSLFAFEVLVRPLAQRFLYHFSGDRMTNRLDKPEYFLNHVLELVDDYSDFVQDNVQLHLLEQYQEGDLSSIPAYTDATCALITSLLPLLQRKLRDVLPEMVKQPGLFSNLIHEVMHFDSRLADELDYAPLSPTTLYRGLSHHVLSVLGYFPAWFSIERDFALSRYDAILQEKNTGEIDYESVDVHLTKPTKAAIRVNDLLETITDRYRTLASFHQKIKFLIDIQIAIFDRFHARLHEGLEAYLTRTSTVARTVHGVAPGDSSDLSGTKGLDRLCRVYGSAEYLEKAMRDWSEDVFFLGLWQDLQYRSQNTGHVKGDLSLGQIAAKTSASVNAQDEDAELQGALFDETAGAYRRLRTRSEKVIVETVVYDLRGSLRAYARVNTWATMSHAGSAPSGITAELDRTLRLLEEYLSFLAKAIGSTPMRRFARSICAELQGFLWDNVLARYMFSTAGVAQLQVDVKGLWKVVDRYTAPAQGRLCMQMLGEGLKLLALPVKGEGQGSGAEDDAIGLWEAERRLFASNESARELLDDLGLELVTESDAREVLKRRVEVSS